MRPGALQVANVQSAMHKAIPVTLPGGCVEGRFATFWRHVGDFGRHYGAPCDQHSTAVLAALGRPQRYAASGAFGGLQMLWSAGLLICRAACENRAESMQNLVVGESGDLQMYVQKACQNPSKWRPKSGLGRFGRPLGRQSDPEPQKAVRGKKFLESFLRIFGI